LAGSLGLVAGAGEPMSDAAANLQLVTFETETGDEG